MTDNAIVDVKELLDELHIDDIPEEEITLNNLISTAQAIVDEAIADKDNPELVKDTLYQSAIKALATQLYYDRTLTAGKAPAVKMMIAHLQYRYAGGSSNGS